MRMTRKGQRDRGHAAVAFEMSSSVTPRPRSASRRWQVSWLAGHRLTADLPGFPVVMNWQTGSPLTVAGAATASSVLALTVFPFDPRREPSSRRYRNEPPQAIQARQNSADGD